MTEARVAVRRGSVAEFRQCHHLLWPHLCLRAAEGGVASNHGSTGAPDFLELLCAAPIPTEEGPESTQLWLQHCFKSL